MKLLAVMVTVTGDVTVAPSIGEVNEIRGPKLELVVVAGVVVEAFDSTLSEPQAAATPPGLRPVTDACLSLMSSSLALPTHSETYDSFGETRGGVHDLGPVLDAMRVARREFITPEDADVEMSVELPVPPAAAWQYNVDPVERQRWACTKFSKDPDEVTPNAQGRLGAGATAHCNHGPGTGIREYIDWRPFAYFTCRTTLPPRMARLVGIPRQIETYEFVPIGEHGTRMVMRVRLMDSRRRSLLRLRPFRHLYAAMFRSWSAALLGIVEEDTTARSQAEVSA